MDKNVSKVPLGPSKPDHVYMEEESSLILRSYLHHNVLFCYPFWHIQSQTKAVNFLSVVVLENYII